MLAVVGNDQVAIFVIVLPESFAMSDLPLSDETPPDQASSSETSNVTVACWMVGIYLVIPVLLFVDEVLFKTFYLSSLFPQLQNPVRILYFPIMCIGYRLGLIPWSPPSFGVAAAKG